MLTAIVPARDEEGRISRLLNNLVQLPEIREILVVLNGSTDKTLDEVKKFSSKNIEVLFFKEALGIDVPRAAGAAWGRERGHKSFLFVDGDLVGDVREGLRSLITNAHRLHLDLALTDCYPRLPQENTLARKMLAFRHYLNKEIGLFDTISFATPSHGPHLVSRRFLEKVPLRELAVPPVAMVAALKKGLAIGVAAKIPHFILGSSIKNLYHSRMVSETIIGDSIEALQFFHNEKRTRAFSGKAYLGYHRERRFDLLEEILASPSRYRI